MSSERRRMVRENSMKSNPIPAFGPIGGCARCTKEPVPASPPQVRIRRLILLVLAAGIGLLVPRGGEAASSPAAVPGTVRVFVTIQPLAFFVDRIGGERVETEVLVGPGQCAETFEATPKQLARMSGARLYFSIGMPMEETLIPRLQGNFPGLQVVDTQEGIGRRDFEEDWSPGQDPGPGTAGEHDHEHEGADPHTWLDPRLAVIIARNVERGLEQADPADSSHFREDLRSLEADLAQVDADVRAILAPAAGREMLVYHPFYGYFARAYGLRQAAIEVGGFRPGSKYMAAIVDRAKAGNNRVIFVQEGVALSAAETVAREIGGRVVTLDPLSRNYLVNLREMARRVRAGLLGE
jgi:zinc transport system substrate-binding protein